MKNENEPVLSPMQPDVMKSGIKITGKDMETLKEMFGAKAVLVFLGKDDHSDCTEETCLGHQLAVRQSGFGEQQVRGIGMSLIENAHIHGDNCNWEEIDEEV